MHESDSNAVILVLGGVRSGKSHYAQELAEQFEGIEAVRRMVPLLLLEADKVTQTTRRLTSTLRRLLDVKAQRERRRVAELLREIQGLAAALAANPPEETIALEVDARIEI